MVDIVLIDKGGGYEGKGLEEDTNAHCRFSPDLVDTGGGEGREEEADTDGKATNEGKVEAGGTGEGAGGEIVVEEDTVGLANERMSAKWKVESGGWEEGRNLNLRW